MSERLGSWGEDRNSFVLIYGLAAQPTTQAMPSMNFINPNFIQINKNEEEEEEIEVINIVKRIPCPYCGVYGEVMLQCQSCGGTIGDDK